MLSAEAKNQAAQLADRAIVVGVAGTGTAWGLQEWSHTAGIAVAVMTAIYVLIKILYLLRMWYLTEQSRQKKPPSDFTPLD